MCHRRREQHANREHFTGCNYYADTHGFPGRHYRGGHSDVAANRNEDAANEHAYARGLLSGSGTARASPHDTSGTRTFNFRCASGLLPAN